MSRNVDGDTLHVAVPLVTFDAIVDTTWLFKVSEITTSYADWDAGPFEGDVQVISYVPHAYTIVSDTGWWISIEFESYASMITVLDVVDAWFFEESVNTPCDKGQMVESISTDGIVIAL